MTYQELLSVLLNANQAQLSDTVVVFHFPASERTGKYIEAFAIRKSEGSTLFKDGHIILLLKD